VAQVILVRSVIWGPLLLIEQAVMLSFNSHLLLLAGATQMGSCSTRM
jgi:hypothetical protein|tara:strand:+ start:291 stop:431 length:141 start_codon:yes stop_codon:yes gene_type:complete